MSDNDATRPNAFLKYVVESKSIISSALAEIILYPSWFVSILRIMKPYTSTSDVVDEMYKDYGFFGFYSGICVGVAHRTLTNIISRNIFQIIHSATETKDIKEELKEESTIDFKNSLLSIASTGLASLLTTPLLTLQNNIIANPSLSFRDIWYDLTSEYGASVLFRGAIPNVISSMIRKSVFLFGMPYVGDLVRLCAQTENTTALNTLTLMGVSLISSFISAPFYFAIVYLQASRNFSNTSECWNRMSESGASVLWSGFPASLVYDLPRSSLQWYLGTKITEITEGCGCFPK